MVYVLFSDTVRAKAWQISTMASIILASPQVGVIHVQHNPHRATHVVHSRLWSHLRRWFFQVHQLSDDARILAESLEDDGQHGGEEDI